MLVIGTGTGGTLTGIARKVKERCPSCKVNLFSFAQLWFTSSLITGRMHVAHTPVFKLPYAILRFFAPCGPGAIIRLSLFFPIPYLLLLHTTLFHHKCGSKENIHN